MKYLKFLVLLIAVSNVQAQKNLEELLRLHNDRTVPYISVQELAMPKTNAIIIDTREFKEFDVSHIENAVFAGYRNFQIEDFVEKIPSKDAKLVVYCSLGIRSENIAEKLVEAGYQNVYNLYGGIFEWRNKGYKVFDNHNIETDNVHAFSPAWGKWLLKGNRIYE